LSETSQTKTAATKPASTKEIDQVLNSLGLGGTEESIQKVANKTSNKQGEHMHLTGIYEDFFSEPSQEEGTEKVATSAEAEATEIFGELVGNYFLAAKEGFFDKIASDDSDEDDESEGDEKPMAELGNKSQLGSAIGKAGDPAMSVNHKASGGEAMKAMTSNSSPYSLKELAFMKSILKRVGKSQPGHVGAYKE